MIINTVVVKIRLREGTGCGKNFVSASSYSPYEHINRRNNWIKGELHSHILNYSGNNQDAPGFGGQVSHSRLMQILSQLGYSFGGLCGHECMPGPVKNIQGRHSPDISLNDIPLGFTPIKIIENQVTNKEPNWPSDDYDFASNWTNVQGNLHRLYLDSSQDSFVVAHPNYYDTANTVSDILSATIAGQSIKAIEVYNRYGEDRYYPDVDDMCLANRGSSDPFAADIWDKLLTSNTKDLNYPIWCMAGGCGFLHQHGDSKVPDFIRYRLGKGHIVAALPDSFFLILWLYSR